MRITYLKLIKIVTFVLIVFFWYYSSHHYTDFGTGCNIKISTSFFEFNSKNIKQALNALKHAYPEKYYTICENIKTIRPGMSCGGWQGGCYYKKTGEIWISTANDEFIPWTAAVIAHETCHNSQKLENRPYSEDECYKVSHKTLTKLVQYE